MKVLSMTSLCRTFGLWLLCGLCISAASADVIRKFDGSEQAGNLVEVTPQGVVFAVEGTAGGLPITVPYRDLDSIRFRFWEWDGKKSKLVIDNRQPTEAEVSGTVKLRAGKHPVGLVYWQGDGPTTMTIEYSGPEIARRKLTSKTLSRRGDNGSFTKPSVEIDAEGFLVPVEYAPVESGLGVRVHEWGPETTIADYGDLKGARVARYANSRTLDIGTFKHAKSNFGAVLSGFVEVPTDGEYTFFLKSSGKAMLWFGPDPGPLHPGSPNLLGDDYMVTAADGGTWWGKLGDWTADKLVISLQLAGQLHAVETPTEMLHELWTTPVVQQELKVDRAQEPASEDSVYVKSADGKTIQRVSGKVLGREGDLLQIEHEGDKRGLKMDRVVGVVFHSRRTTPPPSVGLLTLSGGHQLPGQLISAKRGQNLVFKTIWGQEMTWPYDRAVRLDVRNNRSAWLADLKPASAELIPFFDRRLSWTSNKALDGNPLRIGEKTYTSGICTPSKTVLSYDLNSEYDQFQCDLGLQHDSGQQGNVDVRILLDGTEVYKKTGLDYASGTQPVSVSLTGGKTLTLEVDFGDNYDVGDQVTWGDAKLRKENP